jgi:hypothetical protein
MSQIEGDNRLTVTLSLVRVLGQSREVFAPSLNERFFFAHCLTPSMPYTTWGACAPEPQASNIVLDEAKDATCAGGLSMAR